MFKRKPTRVSVFGAGPSGLLAAWAASQLGYDTTVFSLPGIDTGGKVKKSELFGCQYLHSPIPGFPVEKTEVEYVLNGSTEDYRRKVYGEAWQGMVSPDEYGGEERHSAWDLRATYDRLWSWAQERDMLVSCWLGANNVASFYTDRDNYVINTMPRNVLCWRDHKFVTQDIWAMGTRDTEQALPYRAPNGSIVCNGNDAPRWYRAATVFGYSTLEWPGGARPPISEVVAVKKPLSTDCDCRTGDYRWLHVGRYAKWQKGVLLHTVYTDVMKALR